MKLECVGCCINQVNRVLGIVSLPEQTQNEMMKAVLDTLARANFDKCTPEIMAEIWAVIVRFAGKEDIYGEIKSYFNRELLKTKPLVDELLDRSRDRFSTALKIAIAGNLIDFAAFDAFDPSVLREKIEEVEKNPLTVNDSEALRGALRNAKSLLYIGDNCGEIALDKFFIEELKREFPTLEITFAVRGAPAINDVTVSDAREVNMGEVAEIISSGDSAMGTVMARVSNEFRAAWQAADVVLTKGQGNYESLYLEKKKNLFFLFMAKCKAVADTIGVEKMSVVCLDSRNIVKK